MCDYCGCRSDATIAALSADHERLTVLAGAVIRALDAGNMTSAHRTFRALAGLLSAHIGREEDGLFDELLGAGELTGVIGARCAEHDELGAAVGAALVEGCLEPTGARRALALLADHIWREETDLFPAAALALSAIAFAGAA